MNAYKSYLKYNCVITLDEVIIIIYTTTHIINCAILVTKIVIITPHYHFYIPTNCYLRIVITSIQILWSNLIIGSISIINNYKYFSFIVLCLIYVLFIVSQILLFVAYLFNVILNNQLTFIIPCTRIVIKLVIMTSICTILVTHLVNIISSHLLLTFSILHKSVTIVLVNMISIFCYTYIVTTDLVKCVNEVIYLINIYYVYSISDIVSLISTHHSYTSIYINVNSVLHLVSEILFCYYITIPFTYLDITLVNEIPTNQMITSKENYASLVNYVVGAAPIKSKYNSQTTYAFLVITLVNVYQISTPKPTYHFLEPIVSYVKLSNTNHYLSSNIFIVIITHDKLAKNTSRINSTYHNSSLILIHENVVINPVFSIPIHPPITSIVTFKLLVVNVECNYYTWNPSYNVIIKINSQNYYCNYKKTTDGLCVSNPNNKNTIISFYFGYILNNMKLNFCYEIKLILLTTISKYNE